MRLDSDATMRDSPHVPGKKKLQQQERRESVAGSCIRIGSNPAVTLAHMEQLVGVDSSAREVELVIWC